MSPRSRALLEGLLPAALALALAVAVGELLVLVAGAVPREVALALFSGTWGNAYGLGQVLFKATPLVLTGLAVALPYRAGLFNIGAEGQVVLGALAAGLLGVFLPASTPGIFAAPLCMLAAFGAGAAWGALPGLLKARFGAHEVIASIMLNFVGIALANWLVAGFFAEPETLHTAPIVTGARLSRLGEWLPSLHGSAVNSALLLVPLLLLVAHWVIHRTPFGHRLRSVGQGPGAAEASGVSLPRMTVLSMALGGGLAGLVGVNFVQGYKGYFEDGFSGGVGFMGIAVAMLARAEPLAILPAALLFATLSQGGLAINALVPKELVDILVAVVVLVVAASRAVGGRR